MRRHLGRWVLGLAVAAFAGLLFAGAYFLYFTGMIFMFFASRG